MLKSNHTVPASFTVSTDSWSLALSSSSLCQESIEEEPIDLRWFDPLFKKWLFCLRCCLPHYAITVFYYSHCFKPGKYLTLSSMLLLVVLFAVQLLLLAARCSEWDNKRTLNHDTHFNLLITLRKIALVFNLRQPCYALGVTLYFCYGDKIYYTD